MRSNNADDSALPDPASRGIYPAGTQCFGQQTQLGTVDRQFAGLVLNSLPFAPRMSPRSHFLNDRYKRLPGDRHGQRTAECDPNVLQGNERRFTHNTTGHHAPATATSMFSASSSSFSLPSNLRAIGQRYDRDGNRSGRQFLLTQVRQLLTTRFQFIVKIDTASAPCACCSDMLVPHNPALNLLR